jgi:hypothetical protein
LGQLDLKALASRSSLVVPSGAGTPGTGGRASLSMPSTPEDPTARPSVLNNALQFAARSYRLNGGRRNFFDGYEGITPLPTAAKLWGDEKRSSNSAEARPSGELQLSNKEALLEYIATQLVGFDDAIHTPFGLR